MNTMMNRPRAPSSVLCFTPFLILLLLLFFSPSASAFNITRLLNQFPRFGAFNGYLTKTHLFEQINVRQTITILALDNSTVSAISQNSLDVIKQILSAHVVLDYYDAIKFKKLAVGKPTVLTTMFQATGDAEYEQGFVKVVHTRTGEIAFGSADKNAPFTSRLVGNVASQPYNLSVLQISSPIVVPGIGRYNLPPPVPVPIGAPAPTPAADAPTPDADAPTPDADAPTPDADAPTPDADAPSPDADAPAKSPKTADDDDADADDADAPGPADGDEEDSSAASCAQIAGAGAVIGFLAVALAF